MTSAQPGDINCIIKQLPLCLYVATNARNRGVSSCMYQDTIWDNAFMEAQDRSEVLQIRQDTKYGQVYDKKDVFYFQGSTNLVTNIVFIIRTSRLVTLINVLWFQLRNTITALWPCTVPNLHLQGCLYKYSRHNSAILIPHSNAHLRFVDCFGWNFTVISSWVLLILRRNPTTFLEFI